jgi:hypothetical protein
VTYVLLVLVFALGLPAVAAVGGMHVLTVKNRVVAGRRGIAPRRWLVSPRHAARLHRRLRATMQAARLAIANPDPQDDGLGLGDIVRELETRAMELDAQLVIADHAAPTARRRMLRELQAEATAVESLVERVIRMRRAWTGGQPSERGLGAVRERLALLESALRELDGLEVRPLLSSLPHVADKSAMDD